MYVVIHSLIVFDIRMDPVWYPCDYQKYGLYYIIRNFTTRSLGIWMVIAQQPPNWATPNQAF